MRDILLFRLMLGIGGLLSGLSLTYSIIIIHDIALVFFSGSLMGIMLIVFLFGDRMECKDEGILYNNLQLAQRDSLVWYVSNAMHGFRPPSYQLMLVESFYDKGKTIHTELAKLRDTAEKDDNSDFVKNIQSQLDEWEIILSQLRNRLDDLKIQSRP